MLFPTQMSCIYTATALSYTHLLKNRVLFAQNISYTTSHDDCRLYIHRTIFAKQPCQVDDHDDDDGADNVCAG